MRTPLIFALVATLASPCAVRAAPTVHTSAIAFLAALPGAATTARFDGLPSGTVIASGANADGLSIGYTRGSA